MKTFATTDQTIVFSDIASSTRLYDLLGDIVARNIVTACIELMATAVKAHQGQVIKTIGDEVMSRFDSPDMAAQAAIRMQEQIASNVEMAAHQIQLRIGLHHGPVIDEHGDLFGDAVNVAARMVAQAKAGQIITTHASLEKMSSWLAAAARLIDQTRVKGKQSLIDIYELSWGEPEELTMMSTTTGLGYNGSALTETFLILDTPEQHLRVNHELPVVTMGRDMSNALIISDPKVSRLHARIEMRRAKFILVDQSTNGTFILPKDGQMIHLRRDEMTLGSEGVINLGREADPDSPFAIRYFSV
jgi:adenylate cyclase